MPMAERLEKAKQLYAEAGYGPDKPLEIELLYNTSENHRKIAIAVGSMLKKALGVKLTLTNQEWKVYLERRDQKNYQMARPAWNGDYVDQLNFIAMFLSNAGERIDDGSQHPNFDQHVPEACTTE